MTECFADTFVFLAMINPRDRHHEPAVRLLSSLRQPLVTTSFVLTELADGLSHNTTRATFVALEAMLRGDCRMTILPPAEPLFDAALDLYRSRPDKDWSLTDCASFVVMRERGIAEALTGDHHFEQAGFVAMLK
jgi:predicted nucleic acid-binding protein